MVAAADVAELRPKALEILGHVNKRVKPQPSIPVPVQQVLDAFQDADPKSKAVSMNLLLVYLKMGIERLEGAQERGRIAPELLKRLAQRPLPQQASLLQICTPLLVPWSEYRAPKSIDEKTAKEVDKQASKADQPHTVLGDSADDAVVLSWLRDLLLYQPPSEAALKANPNPAPSPGLSADAVDRLLGPKRECAVIGEALGKRKLAALRLLRWAGFPEEATYACFVLASADPRSEVPRPWTRVSPDSDSDPTFRTGGPRGRG